MNKVQEAVVKSARALFRMFPVILGTILIVSLISVLIPKSFYLKVFTGNSFFDPLIGSLIGSVSAGTPLVSYILGGELLAQGVSFLAVTAFLVAWVTVGIIQLPAEMMILGKKFALLRNLISFLLAIVVAILVILLLEAIQ